MSSLESLRSNEEKLMLRALVLVLILAAALLPGCIAVGGTHNVPKPTTGQELVDLKMALDRGAITQAEYDQKKAKILSAR